LDRDLIELIRIDQPEGGALVYGDLASERCARLSHARIGGRPRCGCRAIAWLATHDETAVRVAAQCSHADAIEALEEAKRARLAHHLSTMHKLAGVHDAGRLVFAARASVAALGESAASRVSDRHRDRCSLQLTRGIAHLLRTDRDCSAPNSELFGGASCRASADRDDAAGGHQGSRSGFELGGPLLLSAAQQSHDALGRLARELLSRDLRE